MAELLLLTRVVPGAGGGAGPAAPPPPPPGPRPHRGGGEGLWGEPLALGVSNWFVLVSQVLLGSLQVALGGSLLATLGDPLGAQLGTPLGSGPVLMVAGAALAAMAKGPSAGRGVLLGTQVLLLMSSAAGAVLAVIGCVAATRGRPKATPMPVVIYQTAMPAPGVGPAEATPPAPQ
ncbi:uncharacterized protein LOC132341372 isoform X3 [Haemorhous mexicanus]|uniref:uncharacterized protein LOC132341372 isoform X3 n=1 Tax=Haemorhous mexicanus TaxID=30427 RepID=UPI0028BF1901|nr:uncharacterized protein LOC132341372 isoform X3 [Haemorhous mexicanus]